MENRAGTCSRFIWGRDSEPLKKGWRLKPGPQMGGGYTKGVVTSRHGISKPPCFFFGVWEIKEGKNRIILLPGSLNSAGKSEDSAWEQFVQPLSQSIKDEYCMPRSRAHVPSARWTERIICGLSSLLTYFYSLLDQNSQQKHFFPSGRASRFHLPPPLHFYGSYVHMCTWAS